MFKSPAKAKRTASLALAATAATAALTLAFVTSASATAAAAPSVSGSPEGAFSRIATFYGAYIDAVYDNDGTRAKQLRAAYLSAPLQRELAKWEETNHADGVLRAQNVPLEWKVTYVDSGMGKTNATVTLTWSGTDTTRLHVQADLKTRKILSITD
ncbi:MULTISPECIES: hypothetical protein [unclassified Streptomyces]|uniref:hypothetical protein n=1 Tax=unclassified Streptomyces TaxID=2593676 RepID=UPI002E11ADB3|nr:hypothetical protein OG299_05295 [Streptomyces sp. NBC_01296]WSW63603.1 hypothetical protein OG513_36325 [Streptomyces sp. NBC_00998]